MVEIHCHPDTKSKFELTRRYSSRMLTSCLSNLHVSSVTRCQYHGGSPVNKFEQVSSDHHQMLLVGGPRADIQGRGEGPQV